MQQSAPEPGIYYDVPFDEYLRWPAVSNSALSYAARSMAHYRYAPQIQPTDAMRFGSLVHCGQLEPAAIGARYAVMPDFAATIRKEDGSEYSNVRATKQYREAVDAWTATIGDKEVVTASEMEQMLGVVNAVINNDLARLWLCSPGATEVSIVWDDSRSSVRCKARIDKLITGMQRQAAIDLKTSRDAMDFPRAMARYGYHRQAAFYTDGLETLLGCETMFGFVVVEKEAPYGIRAARVSEDAIQTGRDEYRLLLAKLALARQTDVWPGYEDPTEWNLPAWYSRSTDEDELGITINGEIVA